MIQDLKDSAKAVGITAFITNSTEKIETQLNRITREEQLPMMLVSWDYVTTLEFNDNGFLNNPSVDITCLLMTKAEDTTKAEMEKSADAMGQLFQVFIQNLRNSLIKYQTNTTQPITGASFTNVPMHGMGKHSGVLGRFTMNTKIINCVEEIELPKPPKKRGIGHDIIGQTPIDPSPILPPPPPNEIGIGSDIIEKTTIK